MKGKQLQARGIAEDYQREKDIRLASGKKEICCPDKDCGHPILRDYHGKVKDAYFAHINIESFDYAIFDKQNIECVRKLRREIYESFKKRGYGVSAEVKILPHHYTHLF